MWVLQQLPQQREREGGRSASGAEEVYFSIKY